MANAAPSSNQRKPAWLRMKPPRPSEAESVLKTVQTFGLETVCREARCPNALDCHARGTATFMILGAICTRACRFCNVATGRPEALDATEPARLALAVQRLGLRYCVITSVDRDDLPDFGAAHFAACIRAVRHKNPDCIIEVLTPDFNGRLAAIEEVVAARPDVFNHNLETVPRLSPAIRPKAGYRQSLQILQFVKRLAPAVTTKSGVMVGLGERPDEVVPVLEDMRAHGVEIVTIGQYLRPTSRHAAVARYIPPAEFAEWARIASELGFAHAFCGPLVRSSFHADEVFATAHAATL